MLFAVGNAALGKKIAITVSLSIILILNSKNMKIWTFTYGCFFVLSAIHVESMVLPFTEAKADIKWQCFSVLLIPFINRQKLNKMLFKSSVFGSFFPLILWFQQSCVLPSSAEFTIFRHGCQCLKVQGLSRYVWSLTRPIPIPVLVHVKNTWT